MFRWIAILLICLQTFFLSGCSSLIAGDQSTNQLVISILSDPKTFNAVLSRESPNIFPFTFEGLTTENYITGEIEPQLAKTWEISDDGLDLIFTLRDDLKWSDGEPLTAKDVVFTYQDLVFNEDIPSNSRDGFRIGDEGKFPIITQLNKTQIQFTLPEPFAPFLRTTGLYILPEHILRSRLEELDSEGKTLFNATWGVDTPPEEIIVNGPYQLDSYAPTERVIFKPNPYYWKQDEAGNSLPHIERIIWQIVQNTETSFLQFRSGSLDGLGVSPEYFSLLKKEEDRGKFTIYNGGSAYGTTFIAFNLNQGKRNGEPLIPPYKSRWFNNVKFRQAVAYSLDRQRMINNIYRGLGQPQNSPISVQSPFYNQNIKSYAYNPEQAKKLLLEAGFTYNSQGQLFDDQGNEVSFNLLTNSGNRIREALGSQIKQDLEKIGMKVNFTPIDFGVLVDKLSDSFDWDCHLIGLTGDNEPHAPNIWFTDGQLHMFNQFAEDLTDWKASDWEKEIEQLYIQGAREINLEKRKAIYNQVQDIVAEQLPFLYLVNPYSLYAVRDKVEGVQYSALGGAFWNIEELKIKAQLTP